MSIKSYGQPTRLARPTVPATGETVNSEPFESPQTAFAMSIYMPTLASSATYKLQMLVPQSDIEGASEVWADLYAYDPEAGTAVQIVAITSNKWVTFPLSVIGGGVFRVVASATQATVPIQFTVTFGVVGAA